MKFDSRALALFLVIFGAFYRVFRTEFVPDWLNFSPLMAIAFCGGVFFSGGLAVAVPLAALLISDLLLNAHYGVSLVNADMIGIYLCYGVAILSGHLLRKTGTPALFAGLIGNSLLFYIVTNTLSWVNLGYAHTAAGWLQALTIGLPGHPPTWVFFRNSLVSDLLFGALFFAAWRVAELSAASSSRVAVPQR